MCEPVTIAAGLMAVTSAAGQYQSFKAAEAQAEYQNDYYEQNKQQANAALAQQYNDIGIRQQQEQVAARQQKEEIGRQARADMATARVAAGAAGVSGLSVERGLRDISGAASRNYSNIDQNLDWTMGQLERQKKSVQTGTASRISSVQKGQQPSKMALGIGLANTAASGYMQHDSLAPKSPKVTPGKSLKSQGGFGSQLQTGGY